MGGLTVDGRIGWRCERMNHGGKFFSKVKGEEDAPCAGELRSRIGANELDQEQLLEQYVVRKV
jgi:hypothetical protein